MMMMVGGGGGMEKKSSRLTFAVKKFLHFSANVRPWRRLRGWLLVIRRHESLLGHPMGVSLQIRKRVRHDAVELVEQRVFPLRDHVGSEDLVHGASEAVDRVQQAVHDEERVHLLGKGQEQLPRRRAGTSMRSH